MTVLYGQDSFTNLYSQMYGDPFEAVALLPEQIPYGLTQPELVLPFQPGEDYHLTSGPHRAWGYGSPWAAIDFAPADALTGCTVSPFLGDFDGTGTGLCVLPTARCWLIWIWMEMKSTGWVIFYLHVAAKDRVPVGTTLNIDDRIGHASCEGGVASGSHVHIARKYNGEWITAGGPIPFGYEQLGNGRHHGRIWWISHPKLQSNLCLSLFDHRISNLARLTWIPAIMGLNLTLRSQNDRRPI